MGGKQETIREKIAVLLKFYRERAGLTIREAGKKLGKSNQTISAWENGRGQPDADMFLKICDVYGIESISVFFDQEEEKESMAGLTIDEMRMLELYRGASEEGRHAAEVLLKGYQLDIKVNTAENTAG